MTGNMNDATRRLRSIQNEADADNAGETPGSARSNERSDIDLLDAYSRAVIGVVERVSAAVIGVQSRRGEDRGGSGSGFLITPDGYALTNSHVVQGKTKLVATTTDGDRLDAELVGDDPATDLALIQAMAVLKVFVTA